ncbi:hypothetical protein NBRC116583_07730 [Arenicella sp. 4NH20-0111]|uniref:hypothetical protein n=1 Tax=Arenicella sp. 4NH20-0111 TaxID=3127648 RepID=UPI00310A0709
MIRLIIALLGIIMLWVWLFSPLGKRPRIVLTIFSMVLAVCLALFEAYSHKPRENLITVSEIQQCGLSVSHRYRSDYRVSLCLKNDSGSANVKRIVFKVIASRCTGAASCEVVEEVSRDIPVSIVPNTSVELMETLRFEQVQPQEKEVVWAAEVVSVKAIP